MSLICIRNTIFMSFTYWNLPNLNCNINKNNGCQVDTKYIYIHDKNDKPELMHDVWTLEIQTMGLTFL